MSIKLSLIISTYNWPDALELVLNSVLDQTVTPYEVLIADDGSKQETTDLVDKMRPRFKCPLKHVWQDDNGFQLAQIRNKAAVAAEGNYIVYLDGDCILRPQFIENHLNLAKPNHFVAGNRVLLSETFTQELLTNKPAIWLSPAKSFSKQQINRPFALNSFPLGPLRNLKSKDWKQLKGCNFALWKEDLIAVNGLDESFIGWGYEDSELTLRLLRRPLNCTSGRFATTVMHIWHKEQDRSQEQENWQRLQDVINSDKKKAVQGIDQYL